MVGGPEKCGFITRGLMYETLYEKKGGGVWSISSVNDALRCAGERLHVSEPLGCRWRWKGRDASANTKLAAEINFIFKEERLKLKKKLGEPK